MIHEAIPTPPLARRTAAPATARPGQPPPDKASAHIAPAATAGAITGKRRQQAWR